MNLEQNLRRAFVPREPVPEFEDVVMARVSVAAQRRGRRFGRPMLYGTILVVTAAAAMLAAGLGRSTIDSDGAALQQGHIVGGGTLPPPRLSPVSELSQDSPAPKEMISAVNSFTVSVQLQNEAKGAAAPAVESLYTALLDKLRHLQGLKLIEWATDGATTIAPSDYMLTVSGYGPQPGSSKFTSWITLIPPGGGISGRRNKWWEGEIGAGCIGAASCPDPASLAASMMEYLRGQVFPPDPALRPHFTAQLMDLSQDPRERLKALIRLTSVGSVSANGAPASLDSAVLRGAANLVTSSGDPDVRASVWRTLRRVRDPDLLPALVASLRDDASIKVRVEALATLSANFRADPRGRAALETTARGDAHPMLRALAQRTLTGDAAWRQYIVSSLQDTALPADERLEAFAYQMYEIHPGSDSDDGYYKGVSAENSRFLDDEMIGALSQALPKATNLSLVGLTTMDLVGTGNPAAVRVVLASAKPGNEYRSELIEALAEMSGEAGVRDTGHRDPLRFPRLHAMLENIRVNDPDLQLRQIAADVLKEAADVH